MARVVFAVVIVTLAEADFVGSVTEAAVMMTVAPEGMAAGAEKSVATPFEDLAVVRDPQAALAQFAVQVTPALAESLATKAVNAAPLETCIDVGAGPRVTSIVVMTVMVAEADFVGSVTEVAVTVTVLPEGAVIGAV